MDTVTHDDTAVRLRRAVTRLNRKLRQSSLAGVSPTQASLLGVIDRLGRPSLGDLATAEQVQPPTVTRLVRDLEGAGLLERVRDAHDGRCTRVVLTARGRREVERIRRRKDEFLERALAHVDRSRAGELVALLEALVEAE